MRFAPYWAEFATGRGFTYAFLWDIKRREFKPHELERALVAYFDGLMGTVARGRKVEGPGTASAATLGPITVPPGWRDGYGGQVATWNAFSKGERLLLNLEIAVRPCSDDRTQVFFALSKLERSDAAWGELRTMRGATGCQGKERTP